MTSARMRVPADTPLVAATALAAVLLAAAAVLRLSVDADRSALSDRLVLVLVGSAILLIGVLAAPRATGMAWGAVSLAAPIAAVEIVTVVRSLEPVANGNAWRDLVLIAAFGLAASAVVTGVYALRRPTGPSREARAAMTIVGVAVLATIAAAVWAVDDAGRPVQTVVGGLTPLRIATRVMLVTTIGAYLVGVARTIGPAVRRAAHRATRAASGNEAGLWRFLGLLADELVPSRTDDRRAAAEAERARLAADLHAHVLPELRRAAAAVESSGAPAEVQVDLRRALEDVEQLMLQRQSIILEQFGLVAALEWLAERTEERSRLRVQLELDDAIPDGPGAIEPRVARAAFRVALLSLDNVVRHAGAATATLRLGHEPGGLRLTVEDDGAAATFQASGGRGIPDMRTAAAESGGAVRFVGDPGARVEATWPVAIAARKHAPAGAAAADRSEHRPA
jgi:signal transduction histidine kinase